MKGAGKPGYTKVLLFSLMATTMCKAVKITSMQIVILGKRRPDCSWLATLVLSSSNNCSSGPAEKAQVGVIKKKTRTVNVCHPRYGCGAVVVE